jgi:hypothetical protein
MRIKFVFEVRHVFTESEHVRVDVVNDCTTSGALRPNMTIGYRDYYSRILMNSIVLMTSEEKAIWGHQGMASSPFVQVSLAASKHFDRLCHITCKAFLPWDQNSL